MSKSKGGKGVQFSEALKNITKQTGVSIDFYSQLDKSSVDIFKESTGLISLDIALGGGLPRGDFVEIFGKPHAGKTTLCFFIMGQFQRRGGVVAFIDVEQDFDPSWASFNGVDIENLIFCQPDTLENALDIADALIKTNSVDLVVIDSLASLTPEAVLTGGMSDDTVGLRPRKMNQFFDKTKFFVKQTKTIVMFTNQWRESMKAFGGSDSPGGWGGKHNFGIRMVVWSNESSDLIKVGSEPIARKSHVKVIKNKVGAPYRESEFRIDFDGGFMGVNHLYDLLEYARNLDIVTSGGAWLTYGDVREQGENKMLLRLAQDEDLRLEINDKVRNALALGGKLNDDEDEEQGVPF